MLIDEERKAIVYPLLVVLGLVLIFAGFNLLYNANVSEYIKEFVAGCIGALITIAATAALLRTQSDGDVIREQLTNMFQLKLAMYTNFIEHLNKTHGDNKLTQKELDSFVDWAVKLSLVAGTEVVSGMYDYLFQAIGFGAYCYEDLDEKTHAEWLRFRKLRFDDIAKDEENLDVYFVSYGDLIFRLRQDLLNRVVANHDEHFGIREQIDEIRNLRGATGVKITEGDAIEYVYQ